MPHSHLPDAIDRDGTLAEYRFLPATCADFLRQLGRNSESIAAYEQALAMTQNEIERAFLLRRIREL